MALFICRLERVCATHFLRPKAVGRVGFKSDLPIDGYHRQMVNRILSPTLPEYRPARWAWRGARWAVGGVGKPERLARWVWVGRFCLGGYGEIGGYMETQKAVLSLLLAVCGWGGVLCVVCCVVVGGLYGNPMRFVGCVMLCAFSGNSLGFRAVGTFGVDYCTFRNLECAIFVCGVGAYMDMGKPWVRSGALELFRLFRGIWKLGEVVLRVWKPRLCAMEKLRGRFGGYGNLKGLFECLKTSVCGAVGNLESAFQEIWKLRGGFLRVWELGILAH